MMDRDEANDLQSWQYVTVNLTNVSCGSIKKLRNFYLGLNLLEFCTQQRKIVSFETTMLCGLFCWL